MSNLAAPSVGESDAAFHDKCRQPRFQAFRSALCFVPKPMQLSPTAELLLTPRKQYHRLILISIGQSDMGRGL
jgi:hypothetical protein